MESDEEGEIVPDIHVTEYVLLDQNEEPISFDVLPLQWSETESIGDLTDIFLEGKTDNGLQKIYKPVIAWKFELSFIQPEISVLSKVGRWLALQKPRKSFETTVRQVLITLHWMHFMKRNTKASAKSVWNHLQQVLSVFDFQASLKDLLCHKLVAEAMKRDTDLAKSKDVLDFVEKPHTYISLHQDVITPNKSTFIVDGDVNEDYHDDDDDDDDVWTHKDIFDPVCAICDNGGNILCCNGRCLRSFHPTKADGLDAFCDSLGFANEAQVDAIPSFLCKNCTYKQHQCYACGELGSSDSSSGQEVFPCVSATCGHFYHPKCAAKLLHPDNEAEAETIREKIAAGDSFTCPMHKCFACKRSEDAEVHDFQFAVCRRCPKAYHRKCLPKSICFEDNMYKNSLQRAWNGLLPYNRALIYCMEHKIIRELGTPSRDRLVFPGLEVKEKKDKLEMLSYREKNLASKRSEVSEDFATSRNLLKHPKLVPKFDGGIQAGASSERTEKHSSRQEFSPSKKPNISIKYRKVLTQDATPAFARPLAGERDKLSQKKVNVNEKFQFRATKADETGYKIKKTHQSIPVRKKVESTRPLIDAEIEKGVLALMEKAESSFDAEEFMKRQQRFTGANASNFKGLLKNSITGGKVEASVKAVRTALAKLEAGDTLEDAKAVCGRDVLKQIFKWKDDLAIYLGPFLHGARYTSFGRHFTKVEKLKEVVGRLHWYVQNGDTIVDFCCGSNDFSCLLKEKLEKVGKSCSYKNYDLFQPKNDFNFEQKDWMNVNPNDLPDGSKLVMGLNPPFGHKGQRAYKFIEKALKFKPKLLILIVPKETKRVDKMGPYDLIWEDDRVLSGKSFYLPGSVDIHDQQLEQWNLRAPPLYLWSHRDWTKRHKAIAQEQGHAYTYNNNAKEVGFNYLMEEKHDCYGDFSKDVNACGGIPTIFDGVPEVSDGFESEGSRGTSTYRNPMQGHFPPSNSVWKNNEWTRQQQHEDVIGMQHEGNGHTDALPKAVSDYEENDDMCIDMEISSPGNIPGDYDEGAGIQGDFGSEMEDGEFQTSSLSLH
ncbi:Zinc finger, PHD-type [Corchorus capsularis]|uniref:Zinc finger, PHD-type n=1 Tax=Corchorus capsularis TaxID=210143 RepID=A0A1R3G4E8_COCAP|nr:Zinc finger, PHD-type [Corchorus capsularis]